MQIFVSNMLFYEPSSIRKINLTTGIHAVCEHKAPLRARGSPALIELVFSQRRNWKNWCCVTAF
jgi:hypothetical protein